MQDEPRGGSDVSAGASAGASGRPSANDARDVARYLHLLRTASPGALEAVHADAFRALTAPQRAELLERIREVLPPSERGLAVPVNGTPVGLARLLARAETRRPGTMARLFGAAAGVGTWAAAGLLGAIAGAVAASAIAVPLLAEAARAMAAGAPSADGWGASAGLEALPAESSDDLVADAGPIDDTDLDLDLGLDDLFDV